MDVVSILKKMKAEIEYFNISITGFLTKDYPKYYYKIQTTTLGHKKIGVCGEVYSLTCFTANPPKSFYYFEDMLTPNGFTGPTAETLATCP